ncbi:MAG: hypothetical protein AB1601_04900, partial [Planctomycetota bacterium]
MRTLSVLCIVLLSAGVVLAQADRAITPIPAEKSVRNAAVEPPRAMKLENAGGEGYVFGYNEMDFAGDGGAKCPPNSVIVGQDAGTSGGTYFYSDLGFCDPANPANCRRVTAENFPPVMTNPPLAYPVRCISWYGSYIDANNNGCVKPSHSFRIQFYNDNNGIPVVNPPFATFTVTANARVVDTINWQGGGSSLRYLYWVVLPSDVNLNKGHVSICGTAAGACYFLWSHSTDGGNMLVYRWWETGATTPTAYTQNDVAYCFGRYIPGSCCNDWTGNCDPNSDDFSCFYSADMGTTPPSGRFTT